MLKDMFIRLPTTFRKTLEPMLKKSWDDRKKLPNHAIPWEITVVRLSAQTASPCLGGKTLLFLNEELSFSVVFIMPNGVWLVHSSNKTSQNHNISGLGEACICSQTLWYVPSTSHGMNKRFCYRVDDLLLPLGVVRFGQEAGVLTSTFLHLIFPNIQSKPLLPLGKVQIGY